MSITRHGYRTQVTCDSCPASYPNTYAAEDWQVMIADAKAAGWIIRKAGPQRGRNDTSDLFGTAPRIAGAKRDEPYTHTCPDCANPLPKGGLL
ncbi:hypothetical protein [Neoaquamicrobium sediminum]|uniref:Ferric uptake regulation protein n=2 Tax=root TaxID=1 RepID=A0AB38ZLF9_9VIRU